jgi:hypothetical protein
MHTCATNRLRLLEDLTESRVTNGLVPQEDARVPRLPTDVAWSSNLEALDT